MRNYDLIKEVKHYADGTWETLLPACGVTVPAKGRHGTCCICGGNDRFHYIDDHGGGEWHCRQCDAPNHGDALDLIARVNCCDISSAARMVADVLGIDYRAAEADPAAASQRREQRDAERQQREQERQQKAAEDAEQRRTAFATKYQALSQQAQPGEPAYLAGKGLPGFTFPVLPDGALLLSLVDESGAVVAAQTITAQGEKRLLSGSAKKGAYHAINAPESLQEVIIGEGLATVLSVHLMRPDALAVVAIDAGNLLPVAQVMRRKYPQAQIIIAADNDAEPGRRNTGKVKADEAAKAVNGQVSLPPGESKSDWNDVLQEKGPAEARQAFDAELYAAVVGHHHTRFPELSDGEALTPDELRALEIINRDYTHVTIGGRHKVVSLKPCQVNGVTHVFEDLAQFGHYFRHIPKVAKRLAGQAWLSWPGKNYKPGGVGFYPAMHKCPPLVFNMFSGLNVEPVPGDCDIYLHHVREVICAGNEEAFAYLLGWMAHLIQRPDEKPSVAIVMKSVQGTGKGTTVRPLMEMMGQYGVHINGAQQVAGRFNATIANKLLVFADEVTIRTQYEADRLKGIISESTINLERKGIDPEPMPNFARLIFASNSTQVLAAGIRERRYLVLEPDPVKAQAKDYFDLLHGWAEDNGAGKLLYLLQRHDISGFDRHRAPQTDALREEILLGLTGVNLFLYQEIMKDDPFRGQVRLSVTGLIDTFIAWSLERGERVKDAGARKMVGSAFAGMGIASQGRSGRGLGKFYELPDIDSLRTAFARHLGMGGYDVFQ